MHVAAGLVAVALPARASREPEPAGRARGSARDHPAPPRARLPAPRARLPAPRARLPAPRARLPAPRAP
ncbi:MAG TPA: hypothetical protein VMU14_02580, partial [Acidimicrobiales bacterium]|nr:hypothetical protein [Acidimicrobiales bacterium]